MNAITVAWIACPFLLGFLIFLLPQFARSLTLLGALASTEYAILLFLQSSPLEYQLLDSFGVSLFLDSLSSYFIITNALVTLAVIFYCWKSNKTAFFYAQLLILHGSINAAFACTDLISLYVALEVSGIAAALLVAYPRSDRTVWVALRYLFVSNTAMLFYLVGAVLTYQASQSFNFAGLAAAPPEAIALIFLGLLVKGGIFISGLWLPLTHSESETPVSAILSGVVVKAGVYPLMRCALMVGEIEPIVRFFGVATALFGVLFAILARDSKRLLAFSSISQMGFILAAPMVGGFYALTHGLVKAALFLLVGQLPSRDFKTLAAEPIPRPYWIALAIASFSISGFPMLAGFGAKILTSKNFLPWQEMAMTVAAVGTATAFAKFIFLPHAAVENPRPLQRGLWAAMVVLLGGLAIANSVYFEAYTWGNVIKPLAIVASGWLLHWLLFARTSVRLPRIFEEFDHLIGMMALMLIFVFVIVLVRSNL